MISALPILSEWRADIVGAISQSPSLEAASGVLGTMAFSLGEDPRLASILYQTGLQAHLGGQLFVRSVEVPESLPDTRALEDDGRPSFLRLPFDEAIEAFLRRGILTRDEYLALSSSMRSRAFGATRLASEQMILRARDLIRQALQRGETLRQFAAQLQSEELSLGVEPSSPWYAETVFRTNVQQSYGSGRLTQLQSAPVVQARPLVQYRTSGDSRVRATHQALDRVVFDRSTDAGWRRFAPPLGYNCRCAIVTRRASQVDDSQIRRSDDLVQLLDPSWSGPGA